MTDAYLDDFRYDLPRDAIRVTVDARSSNTVLVSFWPEQPAILHEITDRILKEGRVRARRLGRYLRVPARPRRLPSAPCRRP